MNLEVILVLMFFFRGLDFVLVELLVRKIGENVESIGDNYEIFVGLVEVLEISIGDSWFIIIYV